MKLNEFMNQHETYTTLIDWFFDQRQFFYKSNSSNNYTEIANSII